MDLTVVLTIGKYALLVALYGFVYAIFRGMIRQLAAETRTETAAARPRAQRPAAVAATAAERPAVRRLRRESQAPQLPPPPEPAPRPVAQSQPAEPEPVARRTSEQPAQPARARLIVLESDDEAWAGEELPLSAAVTIGRSGENSLQLSDRFVSSRHALICLRDGRRILVDRGSTNGTFVNGERVEQEVELKDRDRIAMGNTVFEYRAGQ